MMVIITSYWTKLMYHHSSPQADPRHTNVARRSVNSFWDLNICLLRIYENWNFSLGAFRDLSLKVLEKPLKNFLEVWNPQKWIPHTQKPIPRHKKIQNPSNGSKVMASQNSKKITHFPQTWDIRIFGPRLYVLDLLEGNCEHYYK